jgi:hypothetical protein
MKKMITVKEAASVSGLSEYEIRIGLKQGRFPYYAVGNKGKKFLLDCELFLETLKNISMDNMQAAKEESIENNITFMPIRKVSTR